MFFMKHLVFDSFENALFKRSSIAFEGNLNKSLQHIRSIHLFLNFLNQDFTILQHSLTQAFNRFASDIPSVCNR